MTNLEPAFRPSTAPTPFGPGQPTSQEIPLSFAPDPYAPLQPAPAPAYAAGPSAPAPSAAGPYATAPVATDPGRTLGIVGLVLSFFTALVGLVVSIVALRRSRRAGFTNGFALAGTIVGGLGTLAVVVVVVVGGVTLGGVAAKCQELGLGTHTVDGVTYTCG